MRWVPVLLVGLGACTPEPEPLPVLEPPAPGEGLQFAMTGITAEPFSEIWMCSVYPMPATQTANVNWAKHLNTAGMHHITLSTPALGTEALEYGMTPCEDLYADGALMEGAIIFYGGQGSAEAEMHLPEGTVATLFPTLDVVHEVHFVNATPEPVELYSYVNGYTIPESEVTDAIWGGSVRDEHIVIPPEAEHSEWSRCAFNRDVEVLFLSSHTHGRGRAFTIAPFDGAITGDVLYENHDWHNPSILQFDPPLVVPAGQGFEWACSWKNDDAETVNYGLKSTDEMCNMAVVHTPFDPNARCEVVETSDGVLWAP